MQTVQRAVLLLLIVALFPSCKTYVLLRPGEARVHYYHAQNVCLVIGVRWYPSVDTSWASVPREERPGPAGAARCDSLVRSAKLCHLDVGDSMSVLQAYGLYPDSTFSCDDDDTSYAVFRLALECDYSTHQRLDCECSYYLQSQARPIRYVDFYTRDGIIRQIRYCFWMA